MLNGWLEDAEQRSMCMCITFNTDSHFHYFGLHQHLREVSYFSCLMLHYVQISH